MLCHIHTMGYHATGWGVDCDVIDYMRKTSDNTASRLWFHFSKTNKTHSRVGIKAQNIYVHTDVNSSNLQIWTIYFLLFIFSIFHIFHKEYRIIVLLQRNQCYLTRNTILKGLISLWFYSLKLNFNSKVNLGKCATSNHVFRIKL